MPEKENWLTYTDAEYDRQAPQAVYIDDHLIGSVIDADKLPKYLFKRSMGEATTAHEERMKIIDFAPHFARGVLTLAGMLWAADPEKEKREWGGLGDPAEPGTPMSRIWDDADGRGTNYDTLMRSGLVKLIAHTKRLGVLVEGVSTRGDVTTGPTIKIIPPQSIRRIIYEDGVPISMKVVSERDQAKSQTEKPDPQEVYYIYETDGFTVLRKNEKGEPEIVEDKTPYSEDAAFRYRDGSGRAILPIFTVDLPLSLNMGYIMATKANALMNQENALDFLLWVACFPKLFLDVQNPVTGVFDEDLYNKLNDAIKEGSNVYPGKGHVFGAPPTNPAETKRQILQDKVRGFYTLMFQGYNDAAKEATATEIRQESRRSEEAFMHLAVAAWDEMENGILLRLEQVERLGNNWQGGEVGEASVEHSRDFQPVDIAAVVDDLVNKTFPEGRVPVDAETATRIAVRYLAANGIMLDEDEEAALREAIVSSVAMDASERVADVVQKTVSSGAGIEQAAAFALGDRDAAKLARMDFTNGIEQ